MDIILIISGILCMIAGLAGCFLPILPGPPIAYAGLLLFHGQGAIHHYPTADLAADCRHCTDTRLFHSHAGQQIQRCQPMGHTWLLRRYNNRPVLHALGHYSRAISGCIYRRVAWWPGNNTSPKVRIRFLIGISIGHSTEMRNSRLLYLAIHGCFPIKKTG